MKVENSKRLGEIALDEGVVEPAQLEACLAAQKIVAELGLRKRLGEILVEKKLIDAATLERLLAVQRSRHQRRSVGGYELGEHLGRGGTGWVVAARRVRDGAEVALKFLGKDAERRPGFAERFEREAELASTLFHPHLVRCYGAEQVGRHRALVMELVRGVALDRAIRDDGPLAEREALRLALQLAQALAYLGSKRIVHRDIKPGNVMVDHDGNAKLLDLGLARHEANDTSVTAIGHIIGTPEFMAPEQITSGPLDVRTDVYALGATLYMLCTGRTPYADRGDQQAILRGHLAGDYLGPRDHVPDLSAHVVAVIAKAMATDPAQRYPDMEAFARDLEAARRGEAPATASARASGATALVRASAAAGKGSGRRRAPPSSRRRASSASAARTADAAPAPRVRTPSPVVLALGLGGLALVIGVLVAFLGRGDSSDEPPLVAVEPPPAEPAPARPEPKEPPPPVDPPPVEPPPAEPSPLAAALARAERARASRRHEAALVALDDALRIDSRCDQALRIRAEIYLSLKLWGEALAALEAAREIAPDNWMTWALVAEAHEGRGAADSARSAYERALEVGNRAPAADRERLAERLARLPPRSTPPPPVRPPPTSPVVPQVRLANATVLAVERLVEQWKFAEARAEVERCRATPTYADAARALDATVAAGERAARRQHALSSLVAANRMAASNDHRGAVAHLRSGLAYTDDPEVVTRVNARIEEWRREAEQRVRSKLRELKYALPPTSAELQVRLNALAALRELAAYEAEIKGMVGELERGAAADRSAIDRWLSKLAPARPLPGDERPEGARCERCTGEGFAPCDGCKEGKVERPCSECYTFEVKKSCQLCKGTGRMIVDHDACAGSARRYCGACRGRGVAADLAPLPARTPEEASWLDPAGLYVRRGARAEWVKTRGGSAESEVAVNEGLAWLARHQEPNGSWDPVGFMRHDPMGDVCTGASRFEAVDLGVTGLAVLAFLGAGHTHVAGPYQDQVFRALWYLMGLQGADGHIRERRKDNQHHAIATLALVEAYGMTGSERLRTAAQRAVAYLVGARNQGLGWRYEARDGDNDLSVSGLCAMALWAARASGIAAPGIDESLAQTATWVESITDPEYGVSGYRSRPARGWQGPTSSRYEVTYANNDVVHYAQVFAKNHAPTAIALHLRLSVGYAKNDPRVQSTLLVESAPMWAPADGVRLSRIDFFYWHFGTLAMSRLGGPGWTAWNRALLKALVPNRATKGAARGSWDAVDAWSYAGGRVYATAINVLTLETYYRYAR